MTIAYAKDLTQAMQQAVQDMVDFLVEDKGMSPYDDYSLLSLAGDVRMSRTLRDISPVKMMLSRQILEQLG
jgi:acetamidase/formamidase